MPKVCEFYGVVIRMFYNEHGPPHFHADYGGARASVDFQGNLLRGELPRRALRLVREWTRLHQSELAADWDLARSGRPLVPIEPLDWPGFDGIVRQQNAVRGLRDRLWCLLRTPRLR